MAGQDEDREAGLNGVDLAAVQTVVERYRADAEAGRQPFATTVRWLGGYRTETELPARRSCAATSPSSSPAAAPARRPRTCS